MLTKILAVFLEIRKDEKEEITEPTHEEFS